jgi:alpha-L-arabinofuranosidase
MVVTLSGRSLDGEATATTLTGESTAENSLAQPARVAPSTERVAVSGTSFTRTVPPNSLTVLRVTLASP